MRRGNQAEGAKIGHNRVGFLWVLVFLHGAHHHGREIVRTPGSTYGGEQVWFLCVGCLKGVRKLHLPPSNSTRPSLPRAARLRTSVAPWMELLGVLGRQCASPPSPPT